MAIIGDFAVRQTGPHDSDMSSWKFPLAFLACYISYLLVGGYMFHKIECPGEIEAAQRMDAERREFVRLIEEKIGDVVHVVQVLIRDEINDLYGDSENLTSYINFNMQQLMEDIKMNRSDNSSNSQQVKEYECETWSFFNSLFFSFTSITTIGYGKTTPRTQAGRGACIIYSFFGIPINNIFICSIASFFINKVSA